MKQAHGQERVRTDIKHVGDRNVGSREPRDRVAIPHEVAQHPKCNGARDVEPGASGGGRLTTRGSEEQRNGDRPDRIRKMHTVPVAYLGGVAVFLGWLCGLALANYLNLHRIEPGWPTHSPIIKFSIPLGALVIVVLGLWDDILTIRPSVKIMGQVAAALLLLFDGVGITSMRSVIWPVFSRIGVEPPDWLIIGVSSLFVICAVVGCCNATNLMDGLDGLCGGVTAIIAAGFLFLAVHLAMFGGGMNSNWDALRVVLGLALLGAVLGFIPYNFNPASIFMGDTGSMFLGYSCATLIILLVFVILLNIVFWWLPFFRICLPIGLKAR